jgi:hypothetical protein
VTRVHAPRQVVIEKGEASAAADAQLAAQADRAFAEQSTRADALHSRCDELGRELRAQVPTKTAVGCFSCYGGST